MRKFIGNNAVLFEEISSVTITAQKDH